MAKLLASDGAAGDFFGSTVAVSADTLVVGAPGHQNRGAAYVFERNHGGPNRWGEVAELSPADPSQQWFAGAVAISNDTIVVGARGADDGIGAAYVFERDAGGPDAWGQARKLTASDGNIFDSFGQTVAVWNDTVVVGAPERDAAYVFERDLGGVGAWGEAVRLQRSDPSIGIGHLAAPGLAIHGDTIVAGAYGAYNGPALYSGAVYVFERNQGGPGAWGETAKLAPADIAQNDSFGEGLSLSEDTLAIVKGATGSVYIFERNGAWSEVLRLPTSFNTLPRVAVDGDVLLVGGANRIYTFGRNTGGSNVWGESSQRVASDTTPNARFGWAVDIAGDTMMVGASFFNSFAEGAVYVIAPSPLACPTSYCMAGTTSSGCQATIATRGVQSATSGAGFELVAHGGEGRQNGLFVFSVNGMQSVPWGLPANGCTSSLCVTPPLLRGALLLGSGTLGACDATYTYDLNAHWAAHPTDNPGPGVYVQAQLWFRDTNNPCTGAARVATTSLSNAVQFIVGP